MTSSLSVDRAGFIANLLTPAKGPCRVATTANITLSGVQTIDGVTVESDDRVLVKDQTNGLNGIYVVKSSDWELADDFNQKGDVVQGTRVFVNSGTANALTEWYVSTAGKPIPGRQTITFVQLSYSGIAGLTPTDGYAIIGNGTTWTAAGFTQAGTGAATRTWQAKARDFVHAADFGAVGDGTTNDTAAIQAAIDAMAAAGGGMVLLGPLTYSVTDLTITSDAVGLIGTASGRIFNGTSSQTGTQLKARSGTTTLLTVGSASTASQTIGGVRVENLVLNGNAVATRSFYIKPITNSIFRNLVILGASTSQLETTCYTSGGSFSGLDYVYQCAFENIWVNAGTGSAKGIVLSGEPAGSGGNRTVFCSFRQIHITHKDGTALELNDCDNNSFFNVAVSRNTGGSAVGIDLIGDDVDAQDLVHANMFFFCHAGPGGWSAHGSKAINNWVFGLGTEDTVPVSATSSAELWYFKDTGEGLANSLTLTSGVTAYSATAPSSGGTAGQGIKLSSTTNFGVFFGSSAPTLEAAQGSLYLRTDGSSSATRLYVNTNSSAGWASVVTSS